MCSVSLALLVAISLTDVQMLTSIKHLGRNSGGWEVAETRHFFIFHNQPKRAIERVARVAEQTRLHMFQKWFGAKGERWEPKCKLLLHATGDDFSSTTGVSGIFEGYTRVDIDSSSRRIVLRRIHVRCDITTMMSVALPHEITHVVLFDKLDHKKVPRWAIEGIAMLAESKEHLEEHRSAFLKLAKEQNLFSLKEFMTMKGYPRSSRTHCFYVQAMALTEFMVKEHGCARFTAFLRDASCEGYEVALRRHYACDFADLEKRWRAFVAKQ